LFGHASSQSQPDVIAWDVCVVTDSRLAGVALPGEYDGEVDNACRRNGFHSCLYPLTL
jgi:hypothetical protein